jgi:polysaccharide export outer membrane protein
MFKNLFLTLIFGLTLVSCSTSKQNNLVYFKNIENQLNGQLPGGNDYKITVAPEDELIITVSSEIKEATTKYNLPLSNIAGKGATETTGQPRLQTYIVDKQGNITLPVLGLIHVKGLTTDEIATIIRNKVAEEVKDPYVKVETSGFHVNVMGEVKNPQRIRVNTKRFSILDALAAAGDLTEYGRRDNVMVIREVDGQKSFQRMNLMDNSIFASPYFYLQQNDVVYVQTNDVKADNSTYNQNNGFKLSVISTCVSAVSVIASLIIALTVK